MVSMRRPRMGSKGALALVSSAFLAVMVGAPAWAAANASINGSISVSTIESGITPGSIVTFNPGKYSGSPVVIQNANGATIKLAPGSRPYTGLHFVIESKDITIESTSAAHQAVIGDSTGPVITLGAGSDGATIKDLTFQGTSDPTYSGVITTPGTGANGVTIEDNTFSDLKDTAIGYHGNPGNGSGWTIEDNTIQNLTGSSATNGATGIWLGNLADSTISGNTINGTAWAGILLTGGTGTVVPTDLSSLDSNQRASTNTGDTVSDNVVQNVSHEGIQVAFGSGITVEGNQVSGAGTSGNKNGNDRDGALSLFNPNQTDITVTGNRLVSSFQGVTVGQAAFSEAALGSGITISGNAIENNSNAAVGDNAASGTLNTADNFWGPAGAPSIAGVDTTPFLKSLGLLVSPSVTTPGKPVTVTAAVYDSNGSQVLGGIGAPPAITFGLYASGSTSPVAVQTLPYGTPWTTPHLGVGDYTVTANAEFAGTPSAKLSTQAGLVVSAPSSSSTPPSPPPTPRHTKTTGAASPTSGGTVQATGSSGITVQVSVPANALTVPIEVTVETSSTVPSNEKPLPEVVQVLNVTASTSSGTAFTYPKKPVTLTFQLSAPPSEPVSVAYWNGLLNQWEPIPNVTVNGTTVTATVSHFTTFALVPASAVSAVQRLGGETRMGTAIQAAEAAYPDGAATVVLANAGKGVPSPDALAAAGLAGSLGAPVLLTPAGALSSDDVSALKALGTTTVYVVGGPAAISNAVVAKLEGMGIKVVRSFEGQNRFQTAYLIDQYLYAHQLSTSKTLLVANGATMIDALSGSPVAYSQGDPMLLVNTGQSSISASTLDAFKADGINQVTILGGPAAVSNGIASSLAGTFGASAVSRIGGANRDQTAIAIDQHFFPSANGAVVAANGADGGSFVDALSASALAALNNLPIVLTNPTGLPTSTSQYLSTLAPRAAWIMGGTAAVSSSVESAVATDVKAP